MARLSAELLSSFLLLSFDSIKDFATSKLLWQKGYALVSCGDVWDLVATPDSESLCVNGWVHSEKSSSVLYSVSVTLSPSRVCTNFTCVCAGHSHLPSGTAAQCKHIFALLSACDAIRNFSVTHDPPPQFRRPGMRIYESAPLSVREKVEFDLSWDMILERFSVACPKKRKHSKSYNKFISEKVISKKRKKDIEAEKSAQQIFLEKRNIADLRKECERRGLISQGKKAELVARLL